MAANPNIILIFVDDLGYGDVSCFNENSQIPTRNIDQLAREGMRCTDVHATSAVCTPSRYGILTGRYNWRSRLKSLLLPGQAPALIEPDRLTLGSLLQRAGYRTAAVGKWHLGLGWTPLEGVNLEGGLSDTSLWHRADFGIDFTAPIKDGPCDRGFDYFYGMPASLNQAPFVYIENDHVLEQPDHIIGSEKCDNRTLGTHLLVEYGPAAPSFDPQKVVPDFDCKVLDLVDEYSAGDKPFFIYYATPAVHAPLLPAEEFVGKTKIGPYGDFVMQLDDFVGKLNQKVKDKGIEENTVIIFTSDNGCAAVTNIPAMVEKGHNPSYIYRGCKTDIYEGGHRIPYIVKWPQVVEANSICHQTLSLVDTFATFAEITGTEYSDEHGEDSISNLDIWKGAEKELREATVFHSVSGMYAIRKGKWKLEMCPGSGGVSYPSYNDNLDALPQIQLYDMENDVRETTNVYDKYPEVVDDLKTTLAEYIISGRSTPGKPQESAGFLTWPGLGWMAEYLEHKRKTNYLKS